MSSRNPGPRINLIHTGFRPTSVPATPLVSPAQQFAAALKQFDLSKKRVRADVDKKAQELTKCSQALAKARNEYTEAVRNWNNVKNVVIARNEAPKKRPREEDPTPVDDDDADEELAPPAAKRHLRRWKKEELEVLRKCGEEMNVSLSADAFFRELHKLFSQRNANKRSLRSIRKKARGLGIKPTCESDEAPQDSAGSDTESAKEENV